MIAPVDVTNIRIETERLILRPWQEGDLADFYEYASVDGVGEMAGWCHHTSPEESRAILSSFIRHKKTLALELKACGKVIGSLGLEEPDPDPRTDRQGRELGFVLGKPYWGQGLMPEAVKAVIEYCFHTLDMDFLTCGHFAGNSQSQRVIEKAGFQFFSQSEFPTRCGTVEISRNYILYNPRKITAPFDVTGTQIETERLLLRPWQESDLADFHVFASDPGVAPGMGWELSDSLENSRKLLEKYLTDRESFALVLKETGRVIGDLSIQGRYWNHYPIDQSLRGREYGFGICQEFWGRGLIPEAVAAVSRYCFQTLGFDFLSCGHFRENEKSRRTIIKCGFSHLFDRVTTLPNGKTYEICTYIQYNPNK